MKQKGTKIQLTKRNVLLGLVSILVILAIVISALVVNQSSKENYVYKETKVQFGTLTVGVTERGAVDIGTVEQTFDLDMSALQRVETGNSGGGTNYGSGGSVGSGGGTGFGAGGGMGSAGGMSSGAGMPGMSGNGGLNMFSQMFSGSGNLVGTGEAAALTVGSVKVSIGQQVAVGDVLYELAEESVSELEQELKGNVEKAKADLDAVYADQKLSKQTAKATYESSLAYGEYAQTEYNISIQELQDAVDTEKKTLEKAKTTLTEYQTRLADITESYNDAVKAMDNFKYSLDHTEPTDAYMYVYYYELTEQAEQVVSSLEQQKTQLENNVEQAQSNVDTATQNYAKAKRNLEQGKLSAKQTFELRKLAYNTAQETYDITLAYLEEDALTQEEIYQETQTKWNEFSSYISGNAVLAQYNGVITSVELEEGDSITTGSALVTLYDLEDVSMSVSVYEEDMTDISLGSEAIINFTAYPDDVFNAMVTEISDASTDSNGNVLYDVTITIAGDTSGLFQGMTGDITFITEQSEETLYVVKRAVITENNKSYVKIREEDGDIVKKEVTIGFSDGKYIQIVEGLSEGDIVLIESRVSGS